MIKELRILFERAKQASKDLSEINNDPSRRFRSGHQDASDASEKAQKQLMETVKSVFPYLLYVAERAAYVCENNVGFNDLEIAVSELEKIKMRDVENP